MHVELNPAEVAIVRRIAERNVKNDRSTTLTDLKNEVIAHNASHEEHGLPASRTYGSLGSAVSYYVSNGHANLAFMTIREVMNRGNNHKIYFLV